MAGWICCSGDSRTWRRAGGGRNGLSPELRQHRRRACLGIKLSWVAATAKSAIVIAQIRKSFSPWPGRR
jgi:hypothetical protein